MKVRPPETPTPEWDYADPAFADPGAVERELRRVGEICHQCRRCLPLCPTFPTLFDLVDATDREIEGVSMDGFDRVNELCFHCKQCFNHCPYTPPHEWDVDFPALMRRHQLERTARERVPWTRTLATRTDGIGRAARLAPPLVNLPNRWRPARVLMEKVLGIHRDWVQPVYHRRTASRWFRRSGGARGSGESGRAVLFATCSVEYSDPEVARSAVAVLERSGVRVDLAYAGCCGMPRTDVGDLEGTRRLARRTVESLLPFVEEGAVVVVPGPSCSLLMRQEYPKLLGTDAARRVADATRDLMEHLYHLGREKKLDRDFPRRLGRVAYHAPCHLRAQNVGLRARALLKLVAEDVEVVDACSGVDGTWGMQARFHAESLGVAEKLFAGLREAEPERIATDCPLAALRIREGLGREAVHPVVLLREAYGIPAG